MRRLQRSNRKIDSAVQAHAAIQRALSDFGYGQIKATGVYDPDTRAQSRNSSATTASGHRPAFRPSCARTCRYDRPAAGVIGVWQWPVLLKQMRLKSGIWVAAYLRRCNVEGIFAAVRRRGAEEAGAIFIKINRLDGTGALYGPAPQTAFDEAQPADRLFTALVGARCAGAGADIEARLEREIRFDPDLWIVEIEDRAGRNFLDNVLS